jgi:hypothetical protein
VAPNPEAIAWYVKKAEGLLNDLRARVLALRTRGGQLAGFSGAVLALAGANAESVLDALHGVARDLAGASLLVGSLFLIGALAAALRGTLLPQLVSDISATEVANYTSERFTHEPDLWRIQVRSIHGLLSSIESMTRHANAAARIVEKAEYFFLSDLFTVGLAFATLIVEVSF